MSCTRGDVPTIPTEFGGSWAAFCEQWHPEGALGYSAAEITRGLATLARLWPARAAELHERRARGNWGTAITAGVIDLGLMLAACEDAPNFPRQLEPRPVARGCIAG
jgi:hypothetical protein